jgi:hypothetical protein
MGEKSEVARLGAGSKYNEYNSILSMFSKEGLREKWLWGRYRLERRDERESKEFRQGLDVSREVSVRSMRCELFIVSSGLRHFFSVTE